MSENPRDDGWAPWFAWYRVTLTDGRPAWLIWVRRRRLSWGAWQYIL